MMDRKAALEKYQKAKEAGLVDRDIIPLLDKINGSRDYFTTSSCSGRIAIMELPEIGDKLHSKFLGKWHRAISTEEANDAIARFQNGTLMFYVQSSIIHVVASDIDKANDLLYVGRESGFKYSSIRSISHFGVLVELLSTENISAPLGIDGKVIASPQYISFLVNSGNKTLLRIKNKLVRLEKNISSLLPASS